MQKQRTRRALLSVYDKTPAFADFVRVLKRSGYELIASGGTYGFISGKLELPITSTSDITGLKPIEGKKNVLDHRVETLCEQLHGGLLADEHLHAAELEKLGWPHIDMVVSTFYPLAKTMEEKGGDFVAINNQVDIGGPTLARSAIKGGRIVVVDENDFEYVIDQMTRGHGIRLKDKLWLQSKACATIAAYVAMESVFRVNQLRPKMAK